VTSADGHYDPAGRVNLHGFAGSLATYAARGDRSRCRGPLRRTCARAVRRERPRGWWHSDPQVRPAARTGFGAGPCAGVVHRVRRPRRCCRARRAASRRPRGASHRRRVADLSVLCLGPWVGTAYVAGSPSRRDSRERGRRPSPSLESLTYLQHAYARVARAGPPGMGRWARGTVHSMSARQAARAD
jgi:hypothetical protein